jgi:hypothetical protein
VIAYSAANLVRLRGLNSGSWSWWAYRSADSFATVKAANYVSDAVQRGLKVRDLMIIEDTATPATTLANIKTVTASGATMSATGLVIAE